MTVAIKAASLRDTLRLTVRLLTKSGVEVQFRGHQPHVAANPKTGKVMRLVLPEINDNASPELLKAIQGFLDHEVGHILYTPFVQQTKFANGNKLVDSMLNIVEDIRLEKLMPRDLPGTKLNLQRMYEASIPMMFLPNILKAEAAGDVQSLTSVLMVVALRALAGQDEFQKVMDQENRWIHMRPLTSRMPTLSTRLRNMETSEDAEQIVTDILDALKPPPAPPAPPPPPEEADQDDSGDEGGEGHGDGNGTDDREEDSEEEAGECSGSDDDEGGSDDSDDEGFGGSPDDDSDDSGCDGADEGDDPSDDAGDGENDGDSDGELDNSNSDSDDESNGGEKDTSDEHNGAGGGDSEGSGEADGEGEETEGDENSGGKKTGNLNAALKLLDPTQRRALFLYKNRKKTVAEVAVEMKITEDGVEDLLRKARRGLKSLLAGDKL